MTVLSISEFANTAYKTITVDKNGDYIETQNAYNPVMTIEKIDNEILSKPGDMAISGEKLYIADTGNIMPPKTTWFEPKLRSGLIIHELV